MDHIKLRAHAKINLTLDVKGVLDNGYHEVEMVMQSIGIYDRLVIQKTAEPGIVLNSNISYFTANESNLAYRAAKLLMDEFDVNEGVKIYLYKFIPTSAGLAGGSADAASVLYGVNKIFSLGLDSLSLRIRGAKLGADVPFCLMRGTALAQGIGDELSPLPPCPQCFIVIAKPPVNVSTKVVYEEYDKIQVVSHPDLNGMIRALEAGDLRGVAENTGNVLENVTIPMHPAIQKLKDAMVEYGALSALMSGSGASVYGLFDNMKNASYAAGKIRRSRLAAQVYLTNMFKP